MEPAVEKLEALFQKSEAELDYMEKHLKLDLVNQAAENGSDAPVTQNPALVLEELKVMKARHAALSAQLTQITAAQEESMEAIRRNLRSITELIYSAHNTAAVEVNPLTESQQQAAQLLASAVSYHTAQDPPAAASSLQLLGCNATEFEDLNEDTLESVPVNIRSNVTLTDLNMFYRQLQQHINKHSGSLSVMKMKQLNMNVTDEKLKILQYLGLVQLDRKGHVQLPK